MNKTKLTGLLLCLLVVLGGCNTVGGIGDDLKAAGGAITETAAKAKEKNFKLTSFPNEKAGPGAGFFLDCSLLTTSSSLRACDGFH